MPDFRIDDRSDGVTTRRDWLRAALVTPAVAWSISHGLVSATPPDAAAAELIDDIQSETIFAGRNAGRTWFHPRACRVPGNQTHDKVLMTLQSIGGSDVFGPVHWTETDDVGTRWSKPAPIAGLGRSTIDDGYEEGTCDVVPEFHPPTGTVVAIGHNVYYKDNILARPQRRRHPVYVIRGTDGTWTAPARLEWDDPRASNIYTCGCSQRVTLDDGDLLVPFSFGSAERTHRSVTTVRCSFDGQRIQIRDVGDTLDNSAGRGLLEPSLAKLDGRYYLTIRAEDERGYVAASDDGLKWEPQQAWAWDNGEPLTMSTTQQHWITHSDGLFLVYTRRDEQNQGLFRWRAPLFMAEVDRQSLRLVRASERVVLPLIREGADGNSEKQAARMGNFHTVNVTPEESWVTVGETRPEAGWSGDTLLARIRWSKPNRLVT